MIVSSHLAESFRAVLRDRERDAILSAPSEGVTLTADLLGLGGFPGFGWKQVVGTLVSVVLVAASAWRIFRCRDHVS